MPTCPMLNLPPRMAGQETSIGSSNILIGQGINQPMSRERDEACERVKLMPNENVGRSKYEACERGISDAE